MPSGVVTSSAKNEVLLPHVEQWVQGGIVTGDLSVIPETVLFSRLFSITIQKGGLRPILDPSFLNSLLLTFKLIIEG